eukprot:GHVS01062550.1.p1 GENE.GHVS01062550.1~~GHVS01062550.1.p1  ORF type:complete len:309 (-),score=16.46 GHVS01062550.1:36-872(-)
MDEQTSLCDQHRKKAEKFYDKTKEELKIFAKQRVNKLPWNVLSDVKSGLERDDAVKKCTFVGSASPLLQLRVKGYYTIACATKIGAQIPTTPQHVKGFVFEEKPWSDSVSKTYFMCPTDKQEDCSKRIVKFVRVIYYWETRPCDIVIQTKFYHEILKATGIQLQSTSSVLFEAVVERSLFRETTVPDPVIIVAAFCQHQLMTGSGSKKVFAEIISVMFQETSSYQITKTEDGFKCAKLQPVNVGGRDWIQFFIDGVDHRRPLFLYSNVLKEITDHVLK